MLRIVRAALVVISFLAPLNASASETVTAKDHAAEKANAKVDAFVVAPMPALCNTPSECARRCQSDDAWACYELAEMFQSGNLVPKSESRRTALLKRACEGGEPEACYYSGVSREKQIEVHESACRNGRTAECATDWRLQTPFPEETRFLRALSALERACYVDRQGGIRGEIVRGACWQLAGLYSRQFTTPARTLPPGQDLLSEKGALETGCYQGHAPSCRRRASVVRTYDGTVPARRCSSPPNTATSTRISSRFV